MSFISRLLCTRCGRPSAHDRPQNLCECGGPRLAQYDLQAARRAFPREALPAGDRSIWRYRSLLPVVDPSHVATLGEGWSPLLPARVLGRQLGLGRLYVKDESGMPTGTFKARGASVATSKARELGVRTLVLASSGNAALAFATYGRRAGLDVRLAMVDDIRPTNRIGCQAVGATSLLVPGTRLDAGQAAARGAQEHGWYDAAKEPYRVEGKKTIGYEIAEQLAWRVPDVVVYPAGGGVGLVALSKAFAELAELGWTDGRLPRLVAVQTAGCAPIVRAFEAGSDRVERWEEPRGVANGLRNPTPTWGDQLLKLLRETGGTAVRVTDEQVVRAMRELAETEQLAVCPEGAATVPALRQLVERGWLGGEETVVLVNTGSGVKYADLLDDADLPAVMTDEERWLAAPTSLTPAAVGAAAQPPASDSALPTA